MGERSRTEERKDETHTHTHTHKHTQSERETQRERERERKKERKKKNDCSKISLGATSLTGKSKWFTKNDRSRLEIKKAKKRPSQWKEELLQKKQCHFSSHKHTGT